jgi:thiamine pyrophosphokinase
LTEGDIQLERFPSDKDETDLSLAMTQAVNLGCSTVLIIGGLGGRLDQTLANVGLLAHPAFAQHDVRLDDGLEEVLICRDRAVIHGSIGDVVSLLAWTGTVGGVRTENLYWPLLNESLEPGQTRGISNLMTAENAAVSVASGLLLVVHRRERHSLSTSPTSSSRSLQE